MFVLFVFYMIIINFNRKNVDFDLINICLLFFCLYRILIFYILFRFLLILKVVDKISFDKI